MFSNTLPCRADALWTGVGIARGTMQIPSRPGIPHELDNRFFGAFSAL